MRHRFNCENGREVISNVISSCGFAQKYGGVVPEIASRKHVELIIPVINQALEEADLALEELDGSSSNIWTRSCRSTFVGVSAAKALAFTVDKPLLE